MKPASPVLELEGATHARPRAVPAGPWSLAVGAGNVLAVVGPSGSGKSTLLALLAGALRASAGRVRWEGRDVTRASESTLAVLRRGRIGIVGQSFLLLEHLPLWRGVALGLIARGASRREQRELAFRQLEELGLDARAAERKPAALSGGERQRAAIARALLCAGAGLIADEPTSNQDAASAERVAQVLLARAKAGCALVVATHDPLLSGAADRTLDLGPVAGAR